MKKSKFLVALEIRLWTKQNGSRTKNGNRELNTELAAHILIMQEWYTFIHNNWHKIICCGIIDPELIVAPCILFYYYNLIL
jgi:hypothetical protein